MSQSQVKTMLVCFFDRKGIVHYEFIAQGQTVYLEVLTRLWESFRRKRPGLWPDERIPHHDNASVHDALEFTSSWLRTLLQKWTIHLIHLT